MAPNGKPNAVPRSHGFHERRASSRLNQAVPGDVRVLVGREVAEARRPCAGPRRRRTGRPPRARCPTPAKQLVDAEGQARLAGELIDADEADGEPEGERREPADERAPDQRGHRHEGQHHEREVLRRLELDRESAIGSARNVSRTRPIVPAMNDPIAAVARAGFALPAWPSRSPRWRWPPSPTPPAC